ncbi:MAG TPA: sigma factor, partial [Actinomycetota bacterium]|nr:sigma factor [Actinomycetota bacterium]
MSEHDPELEAAWREHRRYVLDVAYRLLGSVTDAEDVVQEAYARLLRADPSEIDDLRGWLVVVVTRLCLDQLRSARVRHQ